MSVLVDRWPESKSGIIEVNEHFSLNMHPPRNKTLTKCNYDNTDSLVVPINPTAIIENKVKSH